MVGSVIVRWKRWVLHNGRQANCAVKVRAEDFTWLVPLLSFLMKIKRKQNGG